ncbi:MAG: flavodoxin family protein [Desulfurivibrio sp.]|nr:flavodoxin family protein [Desulfurivibrio sp.]
MTLLGISSSPIQGGNVDRMVRYILQKTGKDAKFVNLSQLTFSPCRACAHLCAGDNLCKLEDDLQPWYKEILNAEALVLGTPAYFNNMNGYMTIFLERLWAFRHQKFPLQGKPYAVVASGGVEAPDQAVAAVKNRMNSYQSTFVGDVRFKSSILPCFSCGYGSVCKIGALQMIYGEEGKKQLKVTEEFFKLWEDNPEIVKDVETIVEKLT